MRARKPVVRAAALTPAGSTNTGDTLMTLRRNSIRSITGSLLLGCCAVAALAHDDGKNDDFNQQAYSNHVLVSDGTVPADNMDPNLKNGWGVAFNPTGFVW